MSAHFKKLVKDGEIESRPLHLQRLDAVKSLNDELRKVSKQVETLNESLEKLNERISLNEEESKNKYDLLTQTIEENQNEMVENLESYLVSDNFTPRNNMTDLYSKVNELEQKIILMMTPVSRSRSEAPREARDTDKPIVSKLSIIKKHSYKE